MIDEKKLFEYLDEQISEAKELFEKMSSKPQKSDYDWELSGDSYGRMMSLQYLKYAIEAGKFNA